MTAEAENRRDHDDPLAPARGVINGLIIACALWVVVGAFVWAAWTR